MHADSVWIHLQKFLVRVFIYKNFETQPNECSGITGPNKYPGFTNPNKYPGPYMFGAQ